MRMHPDTKIARLPIDVHKHTSTYVHKKAGKARPRPEQWENGEPGNVGQ